MRLTNVARLDLPDGPVYGYEVHAGATGRALTVSFDQRRHIAMGQRPGSWMAVTFRPPDGTALADLEQAWLAVIARHGTLRTACDIAADGTVLLHEIDVSAGQWQKYPPQTPTWQLVRSILDLACVCDARPAHRLLVAGAHTQAPTVIIGLDHAHADAWSLLVLARDMLTALASVARGEEADVGLPVVAAFAAHSAALAAKPRSADWVHRRWAEVIEAGGGMMPAFPLPLGDLTSLRAEVVQAIDVLDAAALARWEQRSVLDGVRLLPLAVSVLTEVSLRMCGQPLRAVLPVHSRYEDRWHDSVGWFITNAVLECADTDPGVCTAAVKEALRLGSVPLGPIMAPYGGMPAGPGMFALSWLDHRRLPVTVPAQAHVQHVSAITSTDGVMVWFVVDHGGLHLRCRYPDTAQSRLSVESWLNQVCRGLVSSAA